MNVRVLADAENGADWSNLQLMAAFAARGCQADLIDVRAVPPAPPGSLATRACRHAPGTAAAVPDLWLVRVYPSDPRPAVLCRCLQAVRRLWLAGAAVVNPPRACRADYDKAYAAARMSLHGVPVPQTCRLQCARSLHDFIGTYGLPAVIKRNTGGRGLGVRLVRSRSEALEALSSLPMGGEYIIQTFAAPVAAHDVRVCVVCGEAIFSYGRTLTAQGSGAPWMGSCSHGSTVVSYQATAQERRIAEQATRAVGGLLAEVDMQITAAGPIAIEANLTPGYIPGDEPLIAHVVSRLLERLPSVRQRRGEVRSTREATPTLAGAAPAVCRGP